MTQVVAKKELSPTANINRTAIYLLPSEASNVVVQVKPSLRISCICPATNKQVLVDLYSKKSSAVECDIETPTLVWSQLFSRWKIAHSELCQGCMNCTFENSITTMKRSYNRSGYRSNPYQFYLYVTNLSACKEGYFEATPYDLANIDYGYICWGGISYPCSLRQANNSYWHSILNNSPDKYYIDSYGPIKSINEELARKMKAYRPRGFSNHFSTFFGDQYLSSSQKTLGVMVSLDETLGEAHSNYCVNNGRGIKALVGLANRDAADGIWSIDLGEDTIYLSDDQVRIV